MIAPMVVEGAMTGEMFLAYVENGLVPMLRRNDIVVMDNCRVHLGPGIRRAIEKSGATLRYLPKYSPDLKSHRDALQQIQDIPAQGGSANRSRP
jgi:transposase